VAAERILVIEDESGARTALARLLTEEGFSVRTAATGAGGLEQIREFSPDTVVCDFRLPDTTGLQVLRAARAVCPGNLTFIVGVASPSRHFGARPISSSTSRSIFQPFTG
jgi:two-component system response regulator HydG